MSQNRSTSVLNNKRTKVRTAPILDRGISDDDRLLLAKIKQAKRHMSEFQLHSFSVTYVNGEFITTYKETADSEGIAPDAFLLRKTTEDPVIRGGLRLSQVIKRAKSRLNKDLTDPSVLTKDEWGTILRSNRSFLAKEKGKKKEEREEPSYSS